jgi:prepilin-type N-terminal cleavage/methylation domain-containing protein
MMSIDRCAPEKANGRASRRGFTFLEFLVALVVLGVALSGLLPLIAITSRHLQPPKPVLFNNADGSKTTVADCRSPARDWWASSSDYDADTHVQSRQNWLMTPYLSFASGTVTADPWMRKLGASAQRWYQLQPTIENPTATWVSDQSATAGTTTLDLTLASYNAAVTVPSSLVFLDDHEGANNDPTYGSGSYTGGTGTGWIPTAATIALNESQHRKEAIPAAGSSTGGASWVILINPASVAGSGSYSIQATWVKADDQIDDAQFSYRINGAAWTNAQPVDQSKDPAGVKDSGSLARPWCTLTSAPIVLNPGDTVEVALSDVRAVSASTSPPAYIAADAVRIVRSNDVALTSIERSLKGQNNNSNHADMTAKVSVTVHLSQ